MSKSRRADATSPKPPRRSPAPKGAPVLDYRNDNALWASVLVETLARIGVRHAVISPGSRSTPLTVQFARHPAFEAIPVLDERSAAFFALGLARQRNRPVALLCTSGTAGANYFPAVIEAQESGVPLLVITADRPPEMRACRSGQTIDQQKLFGSHVNHYHEMAVPSVEWERLKYLRQTVAHAVERTVWPCRGPVHLNAPFRDPLPPLDDPRSQLRAVRDELMAREEDLVGVIEPFDFDDRKVPPSAGEFTAARRHLRGIIVAGQARPADPVRYATAVGNLARRLGWPVLADALSPLRNHRGRVPNLITRYDVIARAGHPREELEPEHVICLHDWPTSKALRQWLGSTDIPVSFVSLQAENPDALHVASRIVRADVESFAQAVRLPRAAPGWAARWNEWEKATERRLQGRLAGSHPDFEGRVAAALPGMLPPETTVFVANSMPVRDLEYFWPANDRRHVVHCNRGANGIDGTLSTALGVAHGGRPAVLLTGDLAFLHDASGLLLTRKFRGSLTVILINNDGGGIFGHLPVAEFDPPFEEFFATPQKVDFARLCRAHGVEFRRVAQIDELSHALKSAPEHGLRVLEFRTDRKKDAAFRKSLFAEVAAAIER